MATDQVNLRVIDDDLTDEQIAEAEDAQCDAICSPSFFSDGEGGVICGGCGSAVWLVQPKSHN